MFSKTAWRRRSHRPPLRTKARVPVMCAVCMIKFFGRYYRWMQHSSTAASFDMPSLPPRPKHTKLSFSITCLKHQSERWRSIMPARRWSRGETAQATTRTGWSWSWRPLTASLRFSPPEWRSRPEAACTRGKPCSVTGPLSSARAPL